MTLLSVAEITVDFGGLRALNRASLAADEGRITGLIGPNGAGKTTLFDVITGLRSATTGTVVFDGLDLSTLGVHQRARRGIARTFQRLEVFAHLTVRDNMQVASDSRRRWSDDPSASPDELIERIGLTEVADVVAGTLPTGTARLVELARALATGPRLLLLDEPVSGLDQDETGAMAGLLRDLVAEGLGVLLVEHDMSFVMDCSDVIHVLDFGAVIASGEPAALQTDPAVQTAYLGSGAGR
ncbi:MAG: ABC transporter ATP-binding protein [Acidimicrobiia bacterium]|nr:ABC transporter ATP-binding protein [Acidimicrobiia bacterium]